MVYVVERYLPGLSRSDLLRGLARLEQAAADEQTEVRYLGSTIVLEDEACFCQFEGPSEAAVAQANRHAGLTFDRITPAVTVTPTERRDPMEISAPAPRRTVHLSRNRLLGVVAVAAAFAAAITGVIVALTVGGGFTASAKPARSSAEAKYVQEIASLSPAELVAAFGTDARSAAVLASLTLAERQHVESITALTPAQLRAAFGTLVATEEATLKEPAVFSQLTPKERQHVESIMAMTPTQLSVVFGTGSRPASMPLVGSNWGSYWPSVLVSLTPQEQRYVESIMALTPAELRAAFGTGK